MTVATDIILLTCNLEEFNKFENGYKIIVAPFITLWQLYIRGF